MDDTRRPGRPGPAAKPPLAAKSDPPVPALDRALVRPSVRAATGLSDPEIQLTLDELENHVDRLFTRLTSSEVDEVVHEAAGAGPALPPTPAAEAPARAQRVAPAPIEWGSLPIEPPPGSPSEVAVEAPLREAARREAAPREAAPRAPEPAASGVDADLPFPPAVIGAEPDPLAGLESEIEARLDSVIVPDQPVTLPALPPHVVARRAASEAATAGSRRRRPARLALGLMLSLGVVGAGVLVLRLQRDAPGKSDAVQAGAVIASRLPRPESKPQPTSEEEGATSLIRAEEMMRRAEAETESEAAVDARPAVAQEAAEVSPAPVSAPTPPADGGAPPAVKPAPRAGATWAPPPPQVREPVVGSRDGDPPDRAPAQAAERPTTAPPAAPPTVSAAPTTTRPAATAREAATPPMPSPTVAAAVDADRPAGPAPARAENALQTRPLVVTVPPRTARPSPVDRVDGRAEGDVRLTVPIPAAPAVADDGAAAAGPPVTGAVIPGYEPPQVIERFEPVYPDRARRQKQTGRVVLKVLVSEEGRAVRVVVEEGIPGSELEVAAIDAVLRWRYRPAQEHGHAIRGWSTETLEFGP